MALALRDQGEDIDMPFKFVNSGLERKRER
jgi:hypothetical protein